MIDDQVGQAEVFCILLDLSPAKFDMMIKAVNFALKSL